MSTNYRNIEEFLKSKLAGFKVTSDAADDWEVFEKKLKRAVLVRRLKRASVVGVVALLISLGIAIDMDFRDGPEIPGNSVENVQSGDQHSKTPAFLPEPEKLPATQKTGNPVATTSESFKNDELVPDYAGAGKPADVGSQPKQESPTPSTGGNKQQPAGAMADNSSKTADGEPFAKGKGTISKDGSISETGNETTLAMAKPRKEAGEGLSVLAEQDLNSPDSPLNIQITNSQDPLENELQQLTLADHGDLQYGFDGPELSVRPPIQKVKINRSNLGPYISPLQEENPWSYSLNVYPNFTFRKFKVNPEKANYIHRDFIDAVRVGESGGLSMNVGLRISRRIGAITYLNSGIEYINYKTEVQFDFMKYREANLSPITGEIKSYSLISEPQRILFKGQNTYHYLNIPFSISYQPWFNDHIRLNIETGASFMYFITAKGRSINYQTLEIIDLTEREYRNYMASFCFKAGVNYFVSPQLNVGLEPTMVYFTNTIYSSDYPFEVIPYSVGVNLKLQVKLN